MIGRTSGWLWPFFAAVAIVSAPAHAVEHVGEGRLVRMGNTRAGGFDHQWQRMAVQRGDDDLLDDVIDGRVTLDDLLGALREGADDAVGEQHAEEGTDER